MASQPTRQAAYFLRRSEHGREEVIQFPNRQQLAIALSRHCKTALVSQANHDLVFSSGCLSLSILRQSYTQVSHSRFGAVWRWRTDLKIVFEAYGPSGKPLNIKGLLELAAGDKSQSRRARRGGFYCGYGPVPNVHRPRLGHRYFRRIATVHEMRLNQPLHLDTTEPCSRPARRSSNLPNAWEDIAYARRSKGWKEQRKARKSWER